MLTQAQFEELDDNLSIFLIYMEDAHDEFLEAAATKGYRLDYSLDSLPELERYIVEQEVKFVHETDEEMTHFAHCWYHLAMVLRTNFDGKWAVSSNEENSANEGKWVIQGFKSIQEGIEFDPKEIVRRFIKKQKPNALRTAILSSTDPNFFAATHTYLNSLREEEKG
jgi:hypothetical protein